MVKYKEFVQRFPNLNALSKATNAEVLIAWKGMGYNSRALRLRDAARALTSRPSPGSCGTVGRGEKPFPRTMEELMRIPGIGPYTAAAILNFAFDIPTPCIDTNIRRILHRFFVGPESADGTWKVGDRELLEIARKVMEVALQGDTREKGEKRRKGVKGLFDQKIRSSSSFFSSPSFSSSSWHAALMDFGSLVMTKSNPKWELLSPELRSICKAYGKGKVGTKKVIKNEPGIDVDGRFILRRIVRGKVVELLRGNRRWMRVDVLRKSVGLKNSSEQMQWFGDVLAGLVRDALIEKVNGKCRLQD